MIKTETYASALTAAKELEGMGVFLKARGATVLGDLVSLSSSFQAPPSTDMPSVLLRPGMSRVLGDKTAEERALEVLMMTESNDQTSSQHSIRIEALADDIAAHVTSHLSYARNTVKPLVVDLTEKILRFQENAKAIDPASKFEIVSCEVPQFLLDESFVSDGLENYDVSSVDYPHDTRSVSNEMAKKLNIDWHDSVKLVEFLSVGNDRLNKMILEWVATLPEGFLDKTFHAVFANYEDDKYKLDFNYSLPGSPGAQINTYMGLNLLTANFLISSSLMRLCRVVKNSDYAKVAEKAREVMDYTGGVINRYLRTITRQINGGVLVSEVDTREGKAYVHMPVYNAWLEKGGRPETILGMIVSGNVFHDEGAIAEAADKLQKSWNAFVTLSQTEIRRDLENRVITFIKGEVLHGLNNLTDLEREYANGSNNFVAKVSDMLEKEIEHLGHRLLEDIPHTALHLIAKTRFYYTSAYSILSKMEEVAKHNPEIDPRSAALLSTISYLGEYFENQLVLQK